MNSVQEFIYEFNYDLILLIAFLVFSLFWYVGRPAIVAISSIKNRKKSIHIPSDIKNTGVSVVIPCHNESYLIEKTVLSIISQELPCKIEIILVENNSTDNTFEVIKELEAKYEDVIATTCKPEKGEFPISVAMNHGISLASYPILLRLDADTKLEGSTSILNAIEPLLNNRAVASACNVRIENQKGSILTRLQSIEYYFSMEMDRRSQGSYNSIICSSGAMQALKTDLVRKVGGYHTHPNISEDMDMTLKMHRFGKVEMVHTAVSFTDAPVKLLELAKQRYMWMIFGIVCLFAHKKGIGNPNYGVKGVLGFVGLPLKVLTTFSPFIAIIVKAYFAFETGGTINGTEVTDIFILYLQFTFLHMFVNAMMMFFVRPFAFIKQGSDQWYLIPIFILIYQPFLAIVRLIAIMTALSVIVKSIPKHGFNFDKIFNYSH